MQLKNKAAWAFMAGVIGISLSNFLSLNAIAQESATNVEGNELELSDIRAFGIGTDTNVHSVEALDPTEFNDLLVVSSQNGAVWADDPLWIGLQFLQYIGQPITGSRQQVSVAIPGEWEPGRTFDFARITIEDAGWLDDAIAGERYVVWLTPEEDGELTIQRALRANICSRPFQEFYSIQNCP